MVSQAAIFIFVKINTARFDPFCKCHILSYLGALFLWGVLL